MLARYRSGMAATVIRTVHLIPLPVPDATGVASALCGTRLGVGEIETVPPGQGAPCTLCFVAHLSGAGPLAAAIPAGAGPLAAATSYHALGWPVTVRRDQVLLDLTGSVAALIIPAALATEVYVVLATRGVPAPVLVHPAAPGHRILLTGEPFGVPLPWPDEVHAATGHLPLPPARTSAGPVTWAQLPDDHALRCCREIDVFSALRSLSRLS